VASELTPGRCEIHGGRDLAACDHPAPAPLPPLDAAAILADLGAVVSPALTGPGPLVIDSFSCVLCGPATPCDCIDTPFMSPAWRAKMNRVHPGMFPEGGAA
jgi:hypothetical protein